MIGAVKTSTAAQASTADTWEFNNDSIGPVNLNTQSGAAINISVVAVPASLPDGCDAPQATEQFVVLPCDQPPSDNKPWYWPDWLPEPPAFACILWFIANILLLIATAIGIGIAACTAEGGMIAIAISLAIVTPISVLLWLFICAWLPNMCEWARWLPRIISAIGIIFGFIVLAVALVISFLVAAGVITGVLSWPCYIGAVIEFAYYGIFAFVIWEILLVLGCTPLPLLEVNDLFSQPD